MNNLFLKLGVLLFSLLIFGLSTAFAGTRAIAISEPVNGAMISGAVKICMVTHNVEVEPAKKGVRDGKGHHHILVDTDLPKNLSKPIGKDPSTSTWATARLARRSF